MSLNNSNDPENDPREEEPLDMGQQSLPPLLRLVPRGNTELDITGRLLLDLHSGGSNLFQSAREAFESLAHHRTEGLFCLVDFALNHPEERTEAWSLLYRAEPTSSIIAAAALSAIRDHPEAARAYRFLNTRTDTEPWLAGLGDILAFTHKRSDLAFESLRGLSRYDVRWAQNVLSLLDSVHERDTAIVKCLDFIYRQSPATVTDETEPTKLASEISEARKILSTEWSLVWPPTNPNMIVPIAFRFLAHYRPDTTPEI